MTLLIAGCDEHFASQGTGAGTGTGTGTGTGAGAGTGTGTGAGAGAGADADAGTDADAGADASSGGRACGAGRSLVVHFYDLGQALSALVDLPDGRHVLVDTGERPHRPADCATCAPDEPFSAS